MRPLHPSPQVSINEGERTRLSLIYSVYRLLIAVFLLLTDSILNIEPTSLTSLHTRVLFGYLLASAILLMLTFGMPKAYRKYIKQGFLVDAAVFGALLYITQDVANLQIVLLYMVMIATSFILTRARFAATLTACVILIVIHSQVFSTLNAQFDSGLVIDALLLSMCLVAVAYLSYSVAGRLSFSEDSLERQKAQINRLAATNQQVIANMTNGVLVIESTGEISLMNEAAKELLGLSHARELADKMPELMQRLNKSFDTMLFDIQTGAAEHRLRLSQTPLLGAGNLIIIEDTRREMAHAESQKLASLGQLTASIAHEIRNPLAAILGASEMLQIDKDIKDPTDQECINMIYHQAHRMERIIKDVLSLSRKSAPNKTLFLPAKWLPRFFDEYFAQEMAQGTIRLNIATDATATFDLNHLEQILINLVGNALRHAKEGDKKVWLNLYVNDKGIVLDVVDNGGGIAPEHQKMLFTPFFTKSQGGTGLGLYLARSFAGANEGRLFLVRDYQEQGARYTCFRLEFAASLDTFDALDV